MWRLWNPHLNLPGSSFFCFAKNPDFNVIAGNDVAVVQRCCTDRQFEFIKQASTLEMKVIYDLDDDVFDIPEYNPAAKVLHSYREGFKACMRSVDVICVSTKVLADAVKKNVKHMTNLRTGKEIPIIVAENRIEERMFAEPVVSEDLIVGWGGSSSHGGDLELIEDAVRELATENPKVTFEFRGCDIPESMKGLENIVHRYWLPVAEYPARMPRWGWGIALAPVQDLDFNYAKSNIKMQEAAWCHVPCLASWTKPYDEFTHWDKELRWLLCPAKSAWKPKLRELINNEARRKDLGERMYKVMKEHYTWSKPHEGWQQVLQAVGL